MAVIFDNSVINQGNTFNFTVANQPDRILWVITTNSVGATAVTAVTYNGVSMTQHETVTYGSTGNLKIWRLFAPATGSNSVSVTGGSAMNVQAYSYYGVEQTTIEATQVTTGSGGPSGSVTTVAANAVVFTTYAENSSGTRTVSYGLNMGSNRNPTDGTNIASVAGNAQADSGPIASPGATTSALTMTGGTRTGDWAMIQVSLAPVAAVGPANVKTFDGVTQSTGIKTYMGVTVANTKSVDGIA